MATKQEAITRTRMTEVEIEKFAARYAKDHDLKGSELAYRFKAVAVKRLATLERQAKRDAEKAKPKGKKATKK
jgi:hypothetical protein